MFNFIKDLIAPKKCYSCNIEWHFLCNNCFQKIEKFSSICYICKKSSLNYKIHTNCYNNIYYDRLIIMNHYSNNIIKKLIKETKFYYIRDILDDLAYYLWNLLLENIGDLNYTKNDYILISSPMYFFKKLKRWYNVSEILASNISKNIKIDYNKNIIKKVRNTWQQSLLSRELRIINLDKAFKINKRYIDKTDKKVFIIVDDVVSTWTTINEISKLLKEAWANYIIWLVIASD